MNINKVFTGMLALACGSTLAASHIGFLMPSGARQDSRVEIIVGGQGFWGSHGVHISGGGVTVSAAWENGRVTKLELTPDCAGTYKVELPGRGILEVYADGHTVIDCGTL